MSKLFSSPISNQSNNVKAMSALHSFTRHFQNANFSRGDAITTEKIVAATHSGKFHADDLMAAAIIKIVSCSCFGSEVEFVRTRDEDVLAKADIVFDVGGVYDEDNHRYDHHQVSDTSELARENGVPYAAAGLVWKAFGEAAVRLVSTLQGEDAAKVARRIDAVLISAIDAADTGYAQPAGHTLTLSQVLWRFNPTWNNSEANPDASFQMAMRSCQEILIRFIEAEVGSALARDIIRDAEVQDRVMTLERFCPWLENVFELGRDCEVDFVVFPNQDGDWMAQCVPPGLGSFDKKIPLPAEWAGKRDEEIQRLTGVESAIFCHPGRFICGAKTREDALKLADLAKAQHAVSQPAS